MRWHLDLDIKGHVQDFVPQDIPAADPHRNAVRRAT